MITALTTAAIVSAAIAGNVFAVIGICLVFVLALGPYLVPEVT